MALPRHGSLGVYFFAKTNFNAALQDSLGGYTRPVTSIVYEQVLETIGTCIVEFPVTSTYGDLEVPGNVIIFGYQDQWYGAMWVGEGFEITNVETFTAPDGKAMVRLTGESILRELADRLIYYPIADPTTTYTTLSLDAHAPSTNQLTADALQNAVDLVVNSTTSPEPWKESDYVLIELDGGGYHPTIVTTIDGTNITIQDPLPDQASIGNDIQRFNRRVTLTSNTGASPGATIWITPNSGPVFITIIEEMSEVDGVMKVFLRDGMDVAADAGNTVTLISYDNPAIDNLDQLEGMSGGWNITEDSTSKPTMHPADGSSVYKILTDISRMTNEHWRVDIDYATGKPLRRIKWLGESATTTGITTIVFPKTPSDSSYYTDTVKTYTGVAMGGLTVRRKSQGYTRIYPTAGDSGITLYSISSYMASVISAAGYTLKTTGLATYEPPYIHHVSDENTSGIRAQNVTFSNITTDTSSGVATYSAADMLALEALAWLDRNRSEYVEIDVTDVLWNSANPPFVGDRASLGYDSHPTGFWQETWDAPDNTLVIKKAAFSWSSNAVGPRWNLTLANRYSAPDSEGGGLARQFQNYDSSIRRLTGVQQHPPTLGSVVYAGTSDHGELTGLGDDDHGQYWNSSRGGTAVSTAINTHEADVDGHTVGLAMEKAAIGGEAIADDATLFISTGAVDDDTLTLHELPLQTSDLLRAENSSSEALVIISVDGNIGTIGLIRAGRGVKLPEFQTRGRETGDPGNDWTLTTLVSDGGPVPSISRYIGLGGGDPDIPGTWPKPPTQ